MNKIGFGIFDICDNGQWKGTWVKEEKLNGMLFNKLLFKPDFGVNSADIWLNLMDSSSVVVDINCVNGTWNKNGKITKWMGSCSEDIKT